MSMFPSWEGKVWLPPLPDRRQRAGRNSILQLPFRATPTFVRVFVSQYPGYDLLETDLQHPFNRLLLRHRGARRLDVPYPVLIAPNLGRGEELDRLTEFQWVEYGELESHAASPDAVLASWRGNFEFRAANEAEGTSGLRAPQIGALHAISAHFAVGTQFDPATVVLPTGTGKTETMLATYVYRRLRRPLVLVPSNALRTQIFRKFLTLGVLPDEGVVPRELPGPYVARISSGVQSLDDAAALVEKSNVVVALPDALKHSNEEALTFLLEHCSDIIVDEAHHVPASTWSAIRDRFAGKRILQFTATPFRRDGKRIDGKIIFNFRLGDAQAADYYRPINLVTVEDYGDEESRDRSIAEAAIAALRRDREQGLDHLLMARTGKRERADRVWKLYEELASDLNPVLVYSGPGTKRANDSALEKLLDRGDNGARIVVCVDMLGEGFDLPNLKVAALHDTHRSLAITLQFIGRFTRRGARGSIGEATVVTNIADPEAEAKLRDLYAEGADWDRLIRRLSEDRVSQELQLQDVVLSLKESGNLHAQLSLWNLRPALSTQIFRTDCEDWSPLDYRDVLPKDAETWYAVGERDDLLVAVVHRVTKVDWGDYENLFNTAYDLIVAKWDRDEQVLFVYSSDYKGLRTESLARAITASSAELVCGPAIFNILNNVELPLVKNLGSSRIGAISFTSYFGPNVTEGLASIEKSESSLNNIACLGYEAGERVLWGGTQRTGKVWQQKSGTIAEWIAWCARTWSKVLDEEAEEANITRDFLRPERLVGPYASTPVAVQWGEQAQLHYSDKQFLLFDDAEVPMYLVDLDVEAVETDGSIRIRIDSEAAASTYVLRISENVPGGYSYTLSSGPSVRFRRSSGPAVALEEYLVRDPFIIRYADGSHSYNCYHIPTSLDGGVFPKEYLEVWDWSGIPLNKESMNKVVDRATIQYRTYQQIQDAYEVVFNDDGSGEAADLVALRENADGEVHLCLVHCKGAHGGHVSRDIRNFYAVCGQAQKSAAVKHGGMVRLYHDLKRRQALWAKEGASRFLKGDMKQLSYFKEKARHAKLNFEVIIVQPGASAVTITDDALKLLATTELYLKKTTQASFRVAVSA